MPYVSISVMKGFSQVWSFVKCHVLGCKIWYSATLFCLDCAWGKFYTCLHQKLNCLIIIQCITLLIGLLLIKYIICQPRFALGLLFTEVVNYIPPVPPLCLYPGLFEQSNRIVSDKLIKILLEFILLTVDRFGSMMEFKRLALSSSYALAWSSTDPCN